MSMASFLYVAPDKNKNQNSRSHTLGSGERIRVSTASFLRDVAFQDLLHFSSKGQFEEHGQATLNGLGQQEHTPGPLEAPSPLDPPPESQPLQLQPHEQTAPPTQSLMTADDIRRAKRIRVREGPSSCLARVTPPRPHSPADVQFAGLFLQGLSFNQAGKAFSFL